MNKFSRFLPVLFVVLATAIGFGVLYFVGNGVDKTCLYYSYALIGVVLVSYAIVVFFSMGDEYLFLIASMLLSVGVLMLLRMEPEEALKQILWFGFGTVAFFVVFVIFKFVKGWEKLYFVFFWCAIFLYAATLIFGTSVGGVRNWIIIGGISFQFSEPIKILFILTLASIYTMQDEKCPKLLESSNKRQLAAAVVTYVNLGFLAIQGEFGTAVLFFLIYFVMQYIFGEKNYLYLPLNLIFAAGGMFLGLKFISKIQDRVSIWLDPFADSGNLSYQIVQSLYAMSSGGFTGKGLGLGHPEFVPVVKSDFIFAAIVEELGMLGAVAIIMLFFILVYRGVKIALRTNNDFTKAVAMGISLMFGFQTFIIIGGVTKFIPLTGITLPFMSAGGSSLLTSFAVLAILQAISSDKEGMSDEI